MKMKLRKLGADKFGDTPEFFATFSTPVMASHEREMLERLVDLDVDVQIRPIDEPALEVH